jgi:two-component system phosphate regulon response regulator PhoB
MSDAKIIIVEDDPMMADTIASMLELFGYETAICDTAKAALEAIPQEKPGLLLLDVNLPDGTSGIDVCRQVKAQPELSATPVIIVSAEDQPQTVQAALEAGAARYLVKPIGLDDLEKAIAETLNELGRL